MWSIDMSNEDNFSHYKFHFQSNITVYPSKEQLKIMTEQPREEDAQSYKILCLQKKKPNYYVLPSNHSLHYLIYLYTQHLAFTVNQEAFRSRNSWSINNIAKRDFYSAAPYSTTLIANVRPISIVLLFWLLNVIRITCHLPQ